MFNYEAVGKEPVESGGKLMYLTIAKETRPSSS
jgi:hypothetical protein